MKSLGEISTQVVIQNEPHKTGTALALPPRVAPLEANDIEKIELALYKYADIEEKPVYGSVPVCDASGNVYKHEFGLVGHQRQIVPHDDMPIALVEAVARGAKKHHILYHLTRLAAHLRDTRGDIISAVLEDISKDLYGVSEWAVVCACKELRHGQSPFFPATAKIIEVVRQYQDQVNSLVKQKGV